jgi:2-furoyl-CoA dehydrogenase 2Fe-2S iron sulfur subunit
VRLTLNGRERMCQRDRRAGCCRTSCATTSALTGTHVGCEHGVCGACTVQIDGVAQRACLTLAVQVDGREVARWKDWPRATPC